MDVLDKCFHKSFKIKESNLKHLYKIIGLLLLHLICFLQICAMSHSSEKSGIPFHEEIALDKANSMVMILNRTYTSLLNASQDLKGQSDPICVVTLKQVTALKTEVQAKTKFLRLEVKKEDASIDQLKKITNECATTVVKANKAIKTTRANVKT